MRITKFDGEGCGSSCGCGYTQDGDDSCGSGGCGSCS